MELLKIEKIDGQLRIGSVLIAEKLGNEHKATLQMIKKYESKLSAYGRVEFQMRPFETNGGRQISTVAFLNEKQATFIVTLSRNSDKAVELKQNLVDSYFYYREKEKPSIPLNFAEALQLAADQAKQLEEAKPKIESFDKFIDSNGLSNMGQAAKLLGTGRNKLFELLRDEGLLMLSNIPYQKFVDAGYFEVKKKVANGQNYSVTFVTPKGLNYIRKFF